MKRILYLLSFVIAFAVYAQAQTQPKKPAPRAPVQTMKAKLAEAQARNADLQRQYDDLAVLLGNEITDLEARNKKLETDYTGALVILKVLDKEMDGYAGTEEEKKALLTAPSEAMDAGVSIEKRWAKE